MENFSATALRTTLCFPPGLCPPLPSRKSQGQHTAGRKYRPLSICMSVQPIAPPPPHVRAAAALADAIDDLAKRLNPPGMPNRFLQENYQPASESGPFEDIPVTGTLPESLNGMIIRMGPNSRLEPVRGYHMFDGDGMMHALRIKDGKASYVARFVQTQRLRTEAFYNKSFYLKLGDTDGLYGLVKSLITEPLREKLGVLDAREGKGTGNTAVVYHSGRVLVLHETDAPYHIYAHANGDLETLGRFTFGGKLDHPFTAHPKIDPSTGEMFMFAYVIKPPCLTYRRISPEGEMGEPVAIPLSKPVMVHDFAVTEKYAVFMDLPLVLKPESMFEARNIFSYDPSLPARFGVMPRDASSADAIKWFELPACWIFHIANAWDEGDEVVMFACRWTEFQMIGYHSGEWAPGTINPLYEFRFNMRTGEAKQKQMTSIGCEFPRINNNFAGRKQRYTYVSRQNENLSRLIGIIKVDLWAQPSLTASGAGGLTVGEGVIAGYIPFPEGSIGGEPLFIPNANGAEDDGHIAMFVHNSVKEKSELLVWDAKTMAAEPVARVEIPVRVPNGFHATFVAEEQLQQQLQ